MGYTNIATNGNIGRSESSKKEPNKRYFLKSEVDAVTSGFAPDMFLGNIENTYMGTLSSVETAAEENAPKKLNINGYTFEQIGSHTFSEQTGRNKNKDIVILNYQANEQMWGEYPVLQVGIGVWRERKKVKTEIIKSKQSNGTKFW